MKVFYVRAQVGRRFATDTANDTDMAKFFSEKHAEDFMRTLDLRHFSKIRVESCEEKCEDQHTSHLDVQVSE